MDEVLESKSQPSQIFKTRKGLWILAVIAFWLCVVTLFLGKHLVSAYFQYKKERLINQYQQLLTNDLAKETIVLNSSSAHVVNSNGFSIARDRSGKSYPGIHQFRPLAWDIFSKQVFPLDGGFNLNPYSGIAYIGKRSNGKDFTALIVAAIYPDEKPGDIRMEVYQLNMDNEAHLRVEKTIQGWSQSVLIIHDMKMPFQISAGQSDIFNSSAFILPIKLGEKNFEVHTRLLGQGKIAFRSTYGTVADFSEHSVPISELFLFEPSKPLSGAMITRDLTDQPVKYQPAQE